MECKYGAGSEGVNFSPPVVQVVDGRVLTAAAPVRFNPSRFCIVPPGSTGPFVRRFWSRVFRLAFTRHRLPRRLFCGVAVLESNISVEQVPD